MKIILLLMVGTLVGILALRRFSERGGARDRKSVKPVKKLPGRDSSPVQSPFRAVSIEFSGEACAAARELAGKRFLESEAPITPLDGCDLPRCRCRYVHYNDRRGSEDRRNPLPSGQGSFETGGAVDRRQSSDRRTGDTSDSDADSYGDLISSAVRENATER
jgi:hypothetical protein